MNVSNSVNKLQENNLSSSTKKNNDNKQAENALAAAFAQQLTSASSALNPAEAISSLTNSLTSAAPGAAISNALNFNNAISSTGLDPTGGLNQSLKSGIQAQLGSLQTDIATSLIAGLAGQDSATEKTVDTPKSGAANTEKAGINDKTANNDAPLSGADASKSVTNGKTNQADATATSDTAATSDTTAAAKSATTSSIFPETILNLLDSIQNFSFLGDPESENSDQEQNDNTAETQSVNLDKEQTDNVIPIPLNI